ncbi:MAG: PhoH family protein [Acutalibacteraceae bacterium]
MAVCPIDLSNVENVSLLFGDYDENIREIERRYDVSALYRDGVLKISGEESRVQSAVRAIRSLLVLIGKNEPITKQSIDYVISLVSDGEDAGVEALAGDDCVCVTLSGKPVKAKTLGQKKYIEAIRSNTIVFGIGPAGTGKTYLAVAAAVRAFKEKKVSRIILTRPAVEAGEKLGFLPGDLQQKIDPYLRPLYDALFDMLGAETFSRLHEKGVIEVAPLAYMRGRTLDDSFIILDEAQNTTREQMKMFLTRLGFNSKMIVTGDLTQVDLPDGRSGGLGDAVGVLKNVDDIGIVRLSEKDVVRHRLVQSIVKAYEKSEQAKLRARRKSDSSGHGASSPAAGRNAR